MMVLGAIGLALIALGSPVSFLLGAELADTPHTDQRSSTTSFDLWGWGHVRE
ncbi:hypothetical protein [Actinoallomurus oryzae]|uniref:hypothetical protein n=1 Tax=Actinoallomurus oryzae TaxID=502180 RepID=UPI0031ED7101